MTATLALPPVPAAAVVNGLCNVLVLNGVPCPNCGGAGARIYQGAYESHSERCPLCGGSGTVAPSVEPGQRLTIAAVGDDPCPRECGKGVGPTGPQIEVDGRMWTVAYAAADDQFQIQNPDGRWYDVHTRKVVGSAVAASTALPISEDANPRQFWDTLKPGEVAHLLHYVPAEHRLALCRYTRNDARVVTDLSAALPWLPSDPVGRWAVLLEGAATTEQRCPTCWGVSMVACDCGGSTLHMGHPCPTCNRERTCPPVPLPDGVDPEPYTLTELEMTT